MATRTIVHTVRFRRPFVLSGVDRRIPAGSYDVEVEEELLEGVSFAAYRRISTVIFVRRLPGRPGVSYALTVDPEELAAALDRDRAAAECDGGVSLPEE